MISIHENIPTHTLKKKPNQSLKIYYVNNEIYCVLPKLEMVSQTKEHSKLKSAVE